MNHAEGVVPASVDEADKAVRAEADRHVMVSAGVKAGLGTGTTRSVSVLSAIATQTANASPPSSPGVTTHPIDEYQEFNKLSTYVNMIISRPRLKTFAPALRP